MSKPADRKQPFPLDPQNSLPHQSSSFTQGKHLSVAAKTSERLAGPQLRGSRKLQGTDLLRGFRSRLGPPPRPLCEELTETASGEGMLEWEVWGEDAPHPRLPV